jgi:hypothetical protein
VPLRKDESKGLTFYGVALRCHHADGQSPMHGGVEMIKEKATRDEIDGMFFRVTAEGSAAVLYATDGSAVTRIDANVYPVGSDLSARYEHPEGIVLTLADAQSLGIAAE